MNKIASGELRKLGFAIAAARNNTTSTSPRINPKGQSDITKNLDGTVTKGGPRRSWSVPPKTGEVPYPEGYKDYRAIKEIPQQPVAMTVPAPAPKPSVPNLTQGQLAQFAEYPGLEQAAIRNNRANQIMAGQ